jgi:hypothetical protein
VIHKEANKIRPPKGSIKKREHKLDQEGWIQPNENGGYVLSISSPATRNPKKMKLCTKHKTARSANAENLNATPVKTYHERCGGDGKPFQLLPDLQRLEKVEVSYDIAEQDGRGRTKRKQ